MNILRDNKLANYVTMRLGGIAKSIIEIENEDQILEVANWAKNQNLHLITIGQGSNIIFKDSGFDGLVIVNKIRGKSIDSESGVVRIATGENWDELVKDCLDAGLFGIESLSLIPGTVGGAPVNNIGAYGQELKDTLVSLRAFDTTKNQFVNLINNECGFKYRDSRFKSNDHGRFIITNITLRLHFLSNGYLPPNYQAVNSSLAEQNISKPSPADIRRTVIKIRQSKLPDPSVLPNTGSFFKNPIVTDEKLHKLLVDYPLIPHYVHQPGQHKIAAGWLIEQVGLRGFRHRGIWIYDKQALVLVNESAKSFTDLQLMIDKITSKIKQQFDITLDIEPEII